MFNERKEKGRMKGSVSMKECDRKEEGRRDYDNEYNKPSKNTTPNDPTHFQFPSHQKS